MSSALNRTDGEGGGETGGEAGQDAIYNIVQVGLAELHRGVRSKGHVGAHPGLDFPLLRYLLGIEHFLPDIRRGRVFI